MVWPSSHLFSKWFPETCSLLSKVTCDLLPGLPLLCISQRNPYPIKMTWDDRWCAFPCHGVIFMVWLSANSVMYDLVSHDEMYPFQILVIWHSIAPALYILCLCCVNQTSFPFETSSRSPACSSSVSLPEIYCWISKLHFLWNLLNLRKARINRLCELDLAIIGKATVSN